MVTSKLLEKFDIQSTMKNSRADYDGYGIRLTNKLERYNSLR